MITKNQTNMFFNSRDGTAPDRLLHAEAHDLVAGSAAAGGHSGRAAPAGNLRHRRVQTAGATAEGDRAGKIAPSVMNF